MTLRKPIIAAIALLCAGAVHAAAAQAASTQTIYRGATVIDGTGAAPRAEMAIIVEGERIKAILPAAQLAASGDAKVYDAQGMYVVPGLIDSHVHYATNPDRPYAEAELKRNLYGGVTGVRDMAGDARELASLSRDALLNRIPSPDIYYSALVAGPSFFKDPRTVAAAQGAVPGQVPWLYSVDDETDIALAIAQARGTGASGLKIYANLPGPLVAKLIKEGKRQGFPVWTHQQVYPSTPYDTLGATAVSHACMVARYVREAGKTAYGHSGEPSYAGLTAADPGIRDYIAALARSGSLLDATLSVYAPKGTPRCQIELAGDITRAAHKCGDAGANIISMSLGGEVPSRGEERAFNALAQRGVLSIAAAGNDGNNAQSYPAGYASVMSVAALDQNKQIADFSQFTPKVEIAAPGVQVLSTVPMGQGRVSSLKVGATTYAPGSMDGTPAGAVTAPLAAFGLGDQLNPAVAGKVCLIARGSITFGEKVANCQASGGVGAVVYNNAPEGFSGTLGGVATTIPSVTASGAEGAALQNQLGQSATIDIKAVNYALFDGTSMATPHVSAVAALVWSYFPSCTAAQIRSTLDKSAQDLGAPGRDVYYGYGLVQAKAAYDRIRTNGCVN
eukprot:gene30107-37268_t